jgi:hypothetical protein
VGALGLEALRLVPDEAQGKDALLTLNRQLRTATAVVVTAVLAVGLVCVCSAATAAAPRDGSAAAKSGSAKSKKAKERARIRRALTRELKRNPAAILKKGFLRKAALVDYRVPFTVRLGRSNGTGGFETSDDQLEITWDDAANPWPALTPAGQTAGTQLSNLTGSFSMEAIWAGDSTGLGEPGAIETVVGNGISMTASSFAISDFDPFCGTSPQIVTDPGSTIPIVSSGFRYGVMNPFADTIRGTLSLRMTNFASQIYPSCDGVPAVSPAVDNNAAPPMPVRFSGEFETSPAITADGHVRFGKITIDDAVTPQLSTFAYVRACTDAVTCNAQSFPARLKVKKLTAEVLLGDTAG